ncbi:DUF3995 domain-containing protein [Streptomyces sp. NRRL WC-3742]|uniref:DUF3995 domain-containing protein n=1 Tax=Streptomyces sp. NRRL WC-3742 TaxID=1463934 RepID=UPI001F28C91C|nr:DUF3995 domain-containing protein [Streptomyces sp. NRRL WC-3742]
MTAARWTSGWPGYAAAAWGVLFAAPSFYWALGGTGGASTTVSPSLVKLAEDRVTWFLVVLWVTGVLKLVGAVLGIALLRSRGRRPDHLLQLAGWGAGVLLVWHGGLFVVEGLLVQSGVLHIAPELVPVSRWYTFLWGPWFVLGGVCFVLAARLHLRLVAQRRTCAIAGAVGGFGALGLSAAMLLGGIG